MKKIAAIALIGLAAAVIAGWLAGWPPLATRPPPAAEPAAPATHAKPPEKPNGAGPPASPATPGAARPQANAERSVPTRGAQQPQAKPKAGFCQRDLSRVQARENDIPKLRAAGGLIYIFEREARLNDPYGCAAFYLAHGLDVNAVDPRPGHPPLTGLHYAIKRNDPKMVRFMLDHGADPRKPAGKKQLKPYAYVLYLAFHDRRIDRNRVIDILNTALGQ